ncbi:MAG: radical SAM family heme chaperone HemW [Acidobacteriota bacterium]
MPIAESESACAEFAPRFGAARSGLYVHVPFCSAICPYCDFAVSRRRSGDGDLFVAALADEASRVAAAGVGEDVTFDTLYLGGGTPSALSAAQLERLIEALSSRLPLATRIHVTFEANPEDVNRQTARRWHELGVNGVSLGLQSLTDSSLRFLGRRHSAREGREALETLIEVGFEWISADLIYSLPGSDPRRFADELGELPDVPHLSCYELTIHEGTPFARFEARGRLTQLPNVEKARWFHVVNGALAKRGFEHYEVSNFAREGGRSKHNAKYWSGVPYLGLGPSAHSFDGSRRWSNLAPWKEWAAALGAGRSPLAMHETLDAEALRLEELMLRLRTSDGIDLEGYSERHGHDLRESRRDVVERYLADGSLILEGGRLRPSVDGMAIAERLAVDLS